jgi:NAD(P)-dependent dehydrogenase (short-subunit alcohol dehydrogenase family)
MIRTLTRSLLVFTVLLFPVVSQAAENAGTALITGANRGIGLELVKQLKADGWTVIGTARNPGKAVELGATGATVVQLDVTSTESVNAMVAGLKGQAIDLLVNNAGIKGHEAASFDETEFDRILKTLDVNSVGPMRVTQALLPNLEAGVGKTVVQISSAMGSISNNRGGYYGYRASKSALNMLNSSLAIELDDAGFTCVVLHPGWVRTELGGEAASLSVEESVSAMMKVIATLTPESNGHFYNYDGQEVAW